MNDDDMKNTQKTTCFAIGTGRCGTQFLYKLLSKEPHIASHHERHPLSDTFERYCRWNRLAVDQGGFLAVKRSGIQKDLAKNAISFEASAYLSLSLQALYDHFDAKFIFLVRSPHKVVNSYLQKDWYADEIHRIHPEEASGFQPGMEEAHHSFSRLIPRGPDAHNWHQMSRVGKLAWFWQAINREVLNQLNTLPQDSYRIVRIEDLDYAKYLELANFMGYEPQMGEDLFTKLTASRPNRLYPKRQVSDWTLKERTEFEQQVAKLSERWAYPYHTATIIGKEKESQGISSGNLIDRYRRFRKEVKVKKKLISYLERL